ncbi:unnamed protein product [Closterium sp. NIES-65]|nr:unnamed protein product [Closterium sp. NIES-65]
MARTIGIAAARPVAMPSCRFVSLVASAAALLLLANDALPTLADSTQMAAASRRVLKAAAPVAGPAPGAGTGAPAVGAPLPPPFDQYYEDDYMRHKKWDAQKLSTIGPRRLSCGPVAYPCGPGATLPGPGTALPGPGTALSGPGAASTGPVAYPCGSGTTLPGPDAALPSPGAASADPVAYPAAPALPFPAMALPLPAPPPFLHGPAVTIEPPEPPEPPRHLSRPSRRTAEPPYRRAAELPAPPSRRAAVAAEPPSRPSRPSRQAAEPPSRRTTEPPKPPCPAIDFDVWVDDLQLFLQCDRADGLSLFDLTFGASPAPAADADATVCSQWATRDAAARLALCRHLPTSERAHFPFA